MKSINGFIRKEGKRDCAPICLNSEAICRELATDPEGISQPGQEWPPEDYDILKQGGKKP